MVQNCQVESNLCGFFFLQLLHRTWCIPQNRNVFFFSSPPVCFIHWFPSPSSSPGKTPEPIISFLLKLRWKCILSISLQFFAGRILNALSIWFLYLVGKIPIWSQWQCSCRPDVVSEFMGKLSGAEQEPWMFLSFPSAQVRACTAAGFELCIRKAVFKAWLLKGVKRHQSLW